jgi:hypothetical protein
VGLVSHCPLIISGYSRTILADDRRLLTSNELYVPLALFVPEATLNCIKRSYGLCAQPQHAWRMQRKGCTLTGAVDCNCAMLRTVVRRLDRKGCADLVACSW